MNCALIEKHVGPYVDGELDAAHMLELDSHLTECDACQQRLAFEHRCRGLVKTALHVEAPAHLHAIAFAKLEHGGTGADLGLSIRLLPAAAAAAVLIFGGALWKAGGADPASPELSASSGLDDVVRVHRSRLPADVTLDENESRVLSEWFRGRVEFPVNAAQFDGDNVRLVGARVANVREHQAAALYYMVDGRRMTVVVTDAEVNPGRETEIGGRRVSYQDVRGSQVPVRRAAGLNYAFTGDLDRETLMRLAAGARLQQVQNGLRNEP